MRAGHVDVRSRYACRARVNGPPSPARVRADLQGISYKRTTFHINLERHPAIPGLMKEERQIPDILPVIKKDPDRRWFYGKGDTGRLFAGHPDPCEMRPQGML